MWKHTKGLWVVSHENIFSDKAMIASVFSSTVPRSEATANAQLMATAPKLLKALKNLVNDFDKSVITKDPMLIEAREAIKNFE